MSESAQRVAVNVSPLERGGFSSERLTFQPDAENVPSCVHVAIMRCAAVQTLPASHSKTCDTFGAADRTAVGTGLGGPSLVNLNITRPVPTGFVAEHVTEFGPASIENGFCHPRLCQFCRIHIADDDQFVFASDPCGLFVEMVAARVGDFGVNRGHAALVSGALRRCQRHFVFTVMPQSRYALPIAKGGQRRKPKINSYRAISSGEAVEHIALEGNVPTASGILTKGAVLKDAITVPRFPEPESPLEIYYPIPTNPHASPFERHPAKRAPRSAASSKSGAGSLCIPSHNELVADATDCIAVQTKLSRNTDAQINQIKGCRPFDRATRFPSGLRFPLNLATVVPNEIHRAGLALKVLAARRVLNSIFEGKHHA